MSYSAKDYVDIYINKLNWSILPTKADKTPAYYKWKEFQDKHITTDDFYSMYNYARQKGITTTGLALITGKRSGVTVVDFDKGSEDIFSSIKTPTVKTGGGGKHYYFKYTDKIGQSVNKSLNIDIRNDGGYVIIPPSKSIKGSYEWLIDYSTPLADLPESFIQSYTNGVIKHEWSFEGVSEGGRNEASKHVVGKLVATFRDDLTLAWGAFLAWNERNDPPIDEKQLKATFDWCVATDKRNNRIELAHDFSSMSDNELLDIKIRPTLKTGIKEIDSKFPHPAGFYVICANAGTGKGFYALWLSRVFWLNNKQKSVYFSLEMPLDLIKPRILQAWSDLTEEQFTNALAFNDINKLSPSLSMLKQNIMLIDEFGGSDTSGVTTENFKNKIKQYYNRGYRVFHFDHLHELEGANVNDKNQSVTEQWAKTFQGICKDYQDIWLFVYAQPNSEGANKKILRRTDIAGSKAITQKCEFFLSLNRTVKIDEEHGIVSVNNDDREVFVFLDKNRITSAQHIAFNLYFLKTGNFVSKSLKDNSIGMLS